MYDVLTFDTVERVGAPLIATKEQGVLCVLICSYDMFVIVQILVATMMGAPVLSMAVQLLRERTNTINIDLQSGYAS